MREYRNRICSAVLAAVCVIVTALIPSRAVHAEDVVDPIAVQKQAAYDAVPETNGLENWPQGPHVYANSAIVMEMNSGAILYGPIRRRLCPPATAISAALFTNS